MVSSDQRERSSNHEGPGLSRCHTRILGNDRTIDRAEPAQHAAPSTFVRFQRRMRVQHRRHDIFHDVIDD